MNILTCSNNFKPVDGGIAEFMFSVSRSLAASGHNVYAMAPDMEGAAEFDRANRYFHTYRTEDVCPVTQFSFKTILTQFGRFCGMIRGQSRLYKYLLRVVDEKAIGHIVCFHWDVFGVVAWRVSKKRKIPFYVVVHGLDVVRKENTFLWFLRYFFPWFVQKMSLDRAAGIFVNSRYTQALVLRHFSARTKIFLTHCGVDPSIYFKLDPKPVLPGYAAGEAPRILLSMNRLVGHKGTDNAIRGFAAFLKRNKGLNVLYVICGQGPDQARLKGLVAELGLDDQVMFMGYVPESEKNALLNAAAAFIMPSRLESYGAVEGFGIAFLEANACGIPVIGGNSGGIPDAVQEGYSGLLVDPLDVSDIADKIEKLFLDKDYAAKLGDQGRERIGAGFTWDIVARRFETVLESHAQRERVLI